MWEKMVGEERQGEVDTLDLAGDVPGGGLPVRSICVIGVGEGRDIPQQGTARCSGCTAAGV